MPEPTSTLTQDNCAGDATDSNAFILPQWGGIVIANQPSDAFSSRLLSAPDLDDTFALFRKQLLTLVGISGPPAEFELVHAPASISDWQLDTLYRQRALENLRSSRETLQSILKLVDQIPNMPVGQDVKGDFQAALDELELVRISELFYLCNLMLTIMFTGVRQHCRISSACAWSLGPGSHTRIPRVFQPGHARAAVLPSGAHVRCLHATFRAHDGPIGGHCSPRAVGLEKSS